MSEIAKKICLVGDFSVGKTSLIRRFVEDKFSDKYLSTVGVKISRKSISLSSEQQYQQLNLIIWDVEGHTKFKSITTNYLTGASGSIIVGDVTRKETLDRIKTHLDLFLQINPQGIAIIALNKSDLIASEKLQKLASLYDFDNHPQVVKTYTTSAKTGVYVNQIFEVLSLKILNLN
jgi:small GTP-binding protein